MMTEPNARFLRRPQALTLILCGATLASCGDAASTEETAEAVDAGIGADLGTDDAEAPMSIELTPALCDDPSNLQAVLGRLGGGGEGGLGMDPAALQKLLAKPTDRFYMVNLIKYRARAMYADGRETELTGRQANALYNPRPLIQAMGGRIVYSAPVNQQIDGSDDVVWDDVGIVEYPCPIGFLAMITSPEFQETSIHKAAGVETTRVMFTELLPLAAPTDPDQSEASFPPTAEDPAFDLIHVMDFHDVAQYDENTNEPQRTGEQAWNLYQSSGTGGSAELGHYPRAFFSVTGTLIGENDSWDQIHIIRMSSQAGFQALLDNETRQDGRYHRIAALADNDSMVMSGPTLSSIPYVDEGEGPTPLEVTPNGTGTLCQDDADCPDASFICLSTAGAGGFCTPQGCASGTCEGAYLCCYNCNPAVAAQLPFAGSACFPERFTAALTSAPGSCTCD